MGTCNQCTWEKACIYLTNAYKTKPVAAKNKTPIVLGRSRKEQEAVEIWVYQVAFSCVFSKKCCRICKSLLPSSRGLGTSVEEMAPPAHT